MSDKSHEFLLNCGMDIRLFFSRLRGTHIERLLYFVGISTVVLAVLYLFAYPNGSYLSMLSHSNVVFVSLSADGNPFSNNSDLANPYIVQGHNGSSDDSLSSDVTGQRDTEEGRNLYHGSTFEGSVNVSAHINAKDEFLTDNSGSSDDSLSSDVTGQRDTEEGRNLYHGSTFEGSVNVSAHINAKDEFLTDNSVMYRNNGSKLKESSGLQGGSFSSADNSVINHKPEFRKREGPVVSITEMNSLLLNISVEMKSKKPRWTSVRDKELQRAKVQIENAPIQRNISEAHASLFRNYSMFIRSYELMENTLKVYVYREGEKPIFHQPHMRGIYASEGWFMKLIERNKQFVTKDPKRAHLFYLAFSSVKLRSARNGSSVFNKMDMENYLKNYIDKLANKYRFWNQRGGADQFFVACHDWAPKVTVKIFGSGIRVLCNSNIGKGFKLGKDVSFPVTYIRSSENPSQDIGGNPPSNRPILAFFAGGMHGYVRPILLQYWQNKVPDMKIIGPMPRDIEGKAKYREYMKSSKYCICAKGYEVHTPRVVESIYYECVPVIISDNYVPPFFEIFDWEAFALFVSEDDIPNLRDILTSVSEERYTLMQQRVKMVRKYFVWHKVPLKYDLFHMTLHSVWHNRVFQVAG